MEFLKKKSDKENGLKARNQSYVLMSTLYSLEVIQLKAVITLKVSLARFFPMALKSEARDVIVGREFRFVISCGAYLSGAVAVL